MFTDPKLTGYLRRALNHEMAAVQQYLAHSALCELWGMDDLAEMFKHESKEELEHASRLIRHMLMLGLVPNNTQLPTVSATRSLREMWLANWRLEADIIHLYAEASQYCAKVGDEEAYRLFAELLQEERHHLQWVEAQLTALDERGDQNDR